MKKHIIPLCLVALGSAALIGCGDGTDEKAAQDAVQSRNGQAAQMGGHAGTNAPAGAPGNAMPPSSPGASTTP